MLLPWPLCYWQYVKSQLMWKCDYLDLPEMENGYLDLPKMESRYIYSGLYIWKHENLMVTLHQLFSHQDKTLILLTMVQQPQKKWLKTCTFLATITPLSMVIGSQFGCLASGLYWQLAVPWGHVITIFNFCWFPQKCSSGKLYLLKNCYKNWCKIGFN